MSVILYATGMQLLQAHFDIACTCMQYSRAKGMYCDGLACKEAVIRARLHAQQHGSIKSEYVVSNLFHSKIML